MRLVLAVLVTSTGCAQLFGLDETSGPDANTDLATVQLQRVSVGASVIRTPYDLSADTAQFLVDDGAGGFAPVPGTLTGTDAFTADVPGTPPVLFTIADDAVPLRLWALPARVQLGKRNVYEHPNPQPPATTSQLALNVTLPTAYASTESFVMQAIGAWMTRTLQADDLPLPDMAATAIMSTLDYASFTPMIGGNEPARITSADVVLLLRYVGNQLTGVFQAQFDQTDGADPVTGTMSAVNPIDTVMATIDPAGYATRYAAVRPAVTGLNMSWRVSAAPGWSLASDTGVRLNAGVSSTADALLTGMYANPFESLDWQAVFVFATSSTRAFTYTQDALMGSVTLSATMTTVTRPSATLNIDLPAGLPITVRADLQALTTDGMMLALDLTKPVEIDAVVDNPTNTMYSMRLVELGFDMDGTTVTRTVKLDAVTVGDPVFRIPPDLFTVGKTYYIQFRTWQGGYDGAAGGDLQNPSLPYTTATLDSAVFTVGMP